MFRQFVIWAYSVMAMLLGASSLADTLIPLVPPASETIQGFVRVVNHSDQEGVVSIVATDDAGERHPPLSLLIAANETVHLNSEDLERGNASKGLPGGTGSGTGNWRLHLASDLNFDAMGYIRTPDGFLTSMHDLAPPSGDGNRYRIVAFNPGSNRSVVSSLRLTNPGDSPATVVITGTDDRGWSPGSAARLVLDAGRSRTLSARELENGDGVEGALGDGQGKWALTVEADRPIHAMNLVSSPTGHLTNLSSIPPGRNTFVPLFPATGRSVQGVVRVVNHSDEAGEVRIVATDDAGKRYPPVLLSIAADTTVHVDSDDLERGNAAKGISGSTGAGTGEWRLQLESDLDVEALAYVRTKDRFLSSMHDLAPALAGRRRIAIFNPGSNRSAVSLLRLMNTGDGPATVTITGTDDRGRSPGSAVRLTLEAGMSRTLSALELENGDGVEGALGDGQGKWALTVEADRPIHAMSLVTSRTGHLTNLSTVPERRIDGSTNDLAILQPVEATVYQGQNDVPLVLEFAPTISLLEISDASGAFVYRAAGLQSPLSSSIRSANLAHGQNELTLNAQFENGSSTSRTFAVNVQKEPDPASSLDASGLYRLEPSGIGEVTDELHLEQTERVRFMIANTYSDGFVQICAADLSIDIVDTGILSADRNEVSAVSPGTTRASLTCGTYTHRVTVTVNQPVLTGLRIEPDYLLMLGAGAEEEVRVTELYSSGQTKPAHSAVISVADADVLDIAGRTVTALRPGRTTLTATVGDVREEVDVDVVSVVGAGRGMVTVQGGGVLSDSQSFGQGTVSGKLILRPDTVAQDGEFEFELLDPAVLPDIGDREVPIAAFDIGPSTELARRGIVRIENSFSISPGTLVSLSRLHDDGSVRQGVSLVRVSDPNIDAVISGGGTYMLHMPLASSSPYLLQKKHSLSLGLEGTEVRQGVEECDIRLSAPRQNPRPPLAVIAPKVNWKDGSDLSHCDYVLDSTFSKYLQQYRPVLRVKANGSGSKLSLGGELPMRVSDLLSQGKLMWLGLLSLNEIGTDNKVNEDMARRLLEKYDRESIALHIENTDGTSSWRNYSGVPTVYGRIAPAKYREEPFFVLQYWMYYSGSTLPRGGSFVVPDKLGTLWHEGDVEFFQVILDNNKNPIGASSGQHYYGETKHWSEINTDQNGRPIIYIASGSHATHFSGEKDFLTTRGTLGFLAREENTYDDDFAKLEKQELVTESRVTIVPALIEEPEGSKFFNWKGRFGRNITRIPNLTDFTGMNGPRAPYYRGPDDSVGLSMYRKPIHFHLTYLMPGSHFAGMVEALSRSFVTKNSNGVTIIGSNEKTREVLEGKESCVQLKAARFPLNMWMPKDLYNVLHYMGRKGLQFQEYVAESCFSGGREFMESSVGGFFNTNFGREIATRDDLCLYHGENAAESYRRYATAVPTKL